MKEFTITVKEYDDGKIEHFDENNNLIYAKSDERHFYYVYDEDGNCPHEKYLDCLRQSIFSSQ